MHLLMCGLSSCLVVLGAIDGCFVHSARSRACRRMGLQNIDEVLGKRIVVFQLELAVEIPDVLEDSKFTVQLDAAVCRHLGSDNVCPLCL